MYDKKKNKMKQQDQFNKTINKTRVVWNKKVPLTLRLIFVLTPYIHD